jgi:hypothetical protein
LSFWFDGWYLFLPLIVFVCCTELEAKLLGIQEAADVVVGYVHARGGYWEECLLDIPNRVRDAVELDIHRGATVALMVV